MEVSARGVTATVSTTVDENGNVDREAIVGVGGSVGGFHDGGVVSAGASTSLSAGVGITDQHGLALTADLGANVGLGAYTLSYSCSIRSTILDWGQIRSIGSVIGSALSVLSDELNPRGVDGTTVTGGNTTGDNSGNDSSPISGGADETSDSGGTLTPTGGFGVGGSGVSLGYGDDYPSGGLMGAGFGLTGHDYPVGTPVPSTGTGPVDLDGDGDVDGHNWGGGTVQPVILDLNGDGRRVCGSTDDPSRCADAGNTGRTPMSCGPPSGRKPAVRAVCSD